MVHITWKPLGKSQEAGSPIGKSLNRLAGRLGMPPPDVLGAVFKGWPEAVGPAIAEHARPISLRDGVLKVVVDDPQWLTQLRWIGNQVTDRLNAGCEGTPVKKLEAKLE